MKRTVRCLAVFLGVLMMLSLFGCGKQKYKLLFDGYGFESKKTVYAAGDKVHVSFGAVATDTNYHFWSDDDVQLTQDYDNDHGYVFTFTMPEHDVTLHVQSHNSSVLTQPDQIRITLVNRVETADVWILPQTEKNLKTSLWGTASAKDLGADEQRDVILSQTAENGTYLVRIIDDEHAYYAVNDVQLEDGYTVRFSTDDSKFDAVIEIIDADGTVLNTQQAFEGVFGAQ